MLRLELEINLTKAADEITKHAETLDGYICQVSSRGSTILNLVFKGWKTRIRCYQETPMTNLSTSDVNYKNIVEQETGRDTT